MKEFADRLRSSLWPLPVAMMLCAPVLLVAALWCDAEFGWKIVRGLWWIHGGNGDDARNLLSVLSGALMTISSLVFSITLVSLSLAANQFGTRLVRSHMRNMGTKLALGLFLLAILYCLLALRILSKDMPVAEVPHVTVTLGLALSVACVLVLVFFLHGVAHSVIADELVRRVAGELNTAIDGLPQARDTPAPVAGDEALPQDFEERSVLLRSDRAGYVQGIDHDSLARSAHRHGLQLRVDVMPGEFVSQGSWLGRVLPACSDVVVRDLHGALKIGPDRTPVQDLDFSMRHLVDIALRALSPGINDANTALVVIDQVRGALARLLARDLPPGVYRDEHGRCVLLARHVTHADLLESALRPIRLAGATQPVVVRALLQALVRLTEHARNIGQLDAIAGQGQLVLQAFELQRSTASDHEDIAGVARQLARRVARARAG